MQMKLPHPQMQLDYLLPAGREKFRLEEVARILSDDFGKPVSTQSIRNAIDEGRIHASRFAFNVKKGEERRYMVQWIARSDILLTLLEARTAPEEERVQRVLEILKTFHREPLLVARSFIDARLTGSK